MTRAIAFTLLAACSVPVDDRLTEDYTQWGPPIEVAGSAPGHGNTIRRIYVNAEARASNQDFTLGAQPGSIIVKEIWSNNEGQPGTLNYLAIMRREDRIPISEPDGGWLFTRAEEPGGSEVHQGFCWGRCHVAAPFHGAFYDYRDPAP